MITCLAVRLEKCGGYYVDYFAQIGAGCRQLDFTLRSIISIFTPHVVDNSGRVDLLCQLRYFSFVRTRIQTDNNLLRGFTRCENQKEKEKEKAPAQAFFP